MSTGNRIAIIAAGLVAAILGFVALRPADDEGSATSTATTAAQTATQEPETDIGVDVVQGTEEAEPEPEASGPETFSISVKGGKPVGGAQDIEVDRGAAVRIRVTSDTADEVHLHGYDIEKSVAPGQPAVFNVDANLEGIFEMELHNTETPIAELTVNPK